MRHLRKLREITDPRDPAYDGPEMDDDGNIVDANGNIVMTAAELRKAEEEAEGK